MADRVKFTADHGKYFYGVAVMRRAIDGMAVAAEVGGDTRGLSIILSMRAALDAGDLALVKRWMAVLECHANRRKGR